MARVRNLYYNGTMVEQPVYNGVNLTKWIHDGVVVWEQGSAVIEVPVTQISVPQYYDDYSGLAYMAYDGTYLYYLHHYEVTSPRMTNLRCYRVPYSNPSDTPTLLWALDDVNYNISSETFPWFMAALDDTKDYLIKPWDFANKIQINTDGALDLVICNPTYYSNYFITVEAYGLQRKIRQKSDFSVVSSFSTSVSLDFDHTIVLSTSEIVEFSASGYRVFNSSGTQTSGEVFTKSMMSVPVYFNGNFIGVIDETDAHSNHHYKLVRYAYGTNDYVELLDLESENLIPDSNALNGMSNYNVDYNGQYVAVNFVKDNQGSDTEVFLLIDASFNIYMTSSFSVSGGARKIQMIGNYIICPDVPTIFEIEFSSLQQV